MKKANYASVWILAIAVGALILTGTFDGVGIMTFSLISLIGLGLFTAFALWSVIVNPRDSQAQSFKH